MKGTARSSPRRYEVLRTPQFLVRLTYYPADNTLSAHAHDTDQFSILMLGGFAEVTKQGEADLCDVRIGFKPAGLVHQNHFGPNGALILAIDRLPANMNETVWRWRCAHADPFIGQLVRRLLAANEDGPFISRTDMEDIVADLTALIGDQPEGRAGQKDATASWLRRIREEIDDAPLNASLKKLACGAGVHYVHLSRSFAKAYGQPISLYRRRVMAMQAAGALAVRGKTPVQAANEAGFADQSHMTRVMRSEIGLTPKRLRRMLATMP